MVPPLRSVSLPGVHGCQLLQHRAHCSAGVYHALSWPTRLTERRSCAQPGCKTSLARCTTGHGSVRRQQHRVMCMAQPLRVARVASQVKRVVGEMLANDQVMKQAVCGGRHSTDAVTAVAGITDVYVSNDLQVVKIYVSVYSDPKGKRQAFLNLQRLEGYVRRRLGQRLTLRLTPEIRFVYDNSLEESEMVLKVLQDEQARLYGDSTTAAQPESRATSDEDENEEGEEEQEVVVYKSEDVFYQPGPFDSMFVDTSTPSSHVRPQRKPGYSKQEYNRQRLAQSGGIAGRK